MMPDDLARRGRLLLYAAMAAAGGVLGCAGKPSLLWLLVPASLLLTAVSLAAGKYRAARNLAVCLIFLYAAFFMGYARYAAWSGRGGPAGEVILAGRVEVGCRGERDDIVNLFRVTGVVEGGGARCGDLYLLRRGEGSETPFEWGDTLEIKGSLFLFSDRSWDVGGSLNAGEIEVIAHSRNPFLRLAVGYREALRAQVEGGVGGDAGALIQGMVLGDYRMLDAQDLVALRLAGLVHLCAASGLHLAILAGFIIWLGRKAHLSHRAILMLEVPILVVYALAVGLTVPVIRATLVALVAAGAFLLGRDFDFLPALGVAMIYLLCGNPGAAAGVSFQLCFAAALGIALLYRPLSSAMDAGDSKLLALLAATLAAQLAVGPLILIHFGEVSLLAVVSNIIVLPLVPLLMALAMLSSLLGALGLPAAGMLMQAAAFCARCILAVARTLASPHWAALRVYPLSPAWLIPYYASLAAAFLARGCIRLVGRLALGALLAAVLVGGLVMPARSLGADELARITFIDVGQGDAILLEAPSGATVLVDGGKEERTLAAALRSRGITYLDAVVLSHPESDHMDGLEGALEACEVGMLVHPGTENEGRAHAFQARAEEMGVTVRTMRAGDSLAFEGLQLTSFGPPAELPPEGSANECSLVVRADVGGFSLLLPGDVEEEGEGMLMRGPYDLRCDLLKVPHHGGFSHNNEEFFSQVDPDIAVICVGRENSYGHPARATVDALERRGCAVYRTDQRGDIVIHVMEGGCEVVCER